MPKGITHRPMSRDIQLFARNLYVMCKPCGAACNLACDYCYYLEKKSFYASKGMMMDDATLELFTKQYIESQTSPNVMFTWHGGEPLLRPLSFYKKALEYQKRYAAGRRIENSLQTNGTLLTPEWCKFLRDNAFLVGISIDGTRRMHDAYRKNARRGPTFYNVMKGIELLKQYDVEFNVMATVNRMNADEPVEFYDFFRRNELHYIQFTPIVERFASTNALMHQKSTEEGELAEFSVKPGQWGDFLCSVYDEWIKNDVGTYYVQLFDASLANWAGVEPGLCTMAKDCGHAAVMEHNGDLYSCDHYVFPEYKLGNIHSSTILEMMYGEKQKAFAQIKGGELTRQCRECKWLFACNGECPRNRFVLSIHGEQGHNYLCKGYYKFFAHVAETMDFMKNEYMQGRPPANVMKWLKDKPKGATKAKN